MMELLTKDGQSKLVEACTYPLTGLGCVSRVYTDVAVFDLRLDGVAVIEMVSGLTLENLSALIRMRLIDATKTHDASRSS
jgi:3-oxoadipate CoA-transferase beta subunit